MWTPLSLLVLTPLLGALAIGLAPPALAHRVALGVALVELALTGALLASPALHAGGALIGVDGLSLPLTGLTAALFPLAIRASAEVPVRPRSYHAWLLALEAAVMGVFLARDWALFYAAWELTLIPLFFLIGRWGGPRRSEASLTFVQYTMGGSVPTLLALLWLTGELHLPNMAMGPMSDAARHLDPGVQTALLAALAVGFLVKLPVVPLHGWLPLSYLEAPPAITLLLSGLLSKMGAYGLMRAALVLPDGATTLAPWLAALGTLGLVHGALLAWRHDDLKAVVAYGSVSHVGFIALSIATLSPAGWSAALLQMIAHGLSAPLLFLIAGSLEARRSDRRLGAFGGVARSAPRLAVLAITGFVASLGMPGLAGFPGEVAAIVAAIGRWPVATAIAMTGALVWAAAALRTVDLVFLGPPRDDLDDARPHELQAGLPMVAGLLVVGWAPGIVLAASDPTLQLLTRAFTGGGR